MNTRVRYVSETLLNTVTSLGAVNRMAAHDQVGSTVSWDELVRAAVTEHPLVLDGRFGRSGRGGNKPAFVASLIVGILAALVYVACDLSPIWGLASVYDGIIASAADAPDPETAIPQAGIFYSVAAVLMVVSRIHWLIARRPRNGFTKFSRT